MGQILTTVSGLTGGVTAVAGVAKRYRMAVTSTWAVDELITLLFTLTQTGNPLQIGAGDITGKSPAFCFTLKRKEYLTAGSKLFFSAFDDAVTFNNLNGLGNGFLSIADNYAMSEDLQSVAPYQGKLALFGRGNTQIWVTGVDPGSYQQTQVLDNIGTFAADSVRAKGELDVFFLHDTGVRSLRARDASSNAYPIDIGSPIDLLIQAKIQSATTNELASACGVIEPITGQYWLFLKDTMYVLSDHPNAKITAWSTWDCSYQAVSGTGMQFKNTFGFSINFKYGLVNDVNLATNYGTVGAGVTTTALTPFLYFWIYSVDETTFVGGFSVPSGLGFSGVVIFGGFSVTETPKQTAIVPQKFEVHKGQVFISASDAFYVYGGADKNTYDNTVCSVETSWLDSDSPANSKQYHGVDIAQAGTWNHYISTDYLNGSMQAVMLAQNNPTFDGGKIDYSAHGTHVKHRTQTTGTAERCVLSNLLIHLKTTGQK